MRWAFGLMLVLVIGCTDNSRARNWGGKATTDIPKGRKVVNVTWKDSNLWVLTRAMKSDEEAEEYNFTENSSWGILEGTMILKESK